MGENATVMGKACDISATHEHFFTSGMRAGLRLGGGDVAWNSKVARSDRGIPRQGWMDYLMMILVSFVQLLVMIWDGIFEVMLSRKGERSGETE
jgi:hypothetical protein